MWEYWQPQPRANVLLAWITLVEFKDLHGRRYRFAAGGSRSNRRLITGYRSSCFGFTLLLLLDFTLARLLC